MARTKMNMFANTCTLFVESKKSMSAVRMYQAYMRKLVEDLLSIMGRKEFSRNLRNCLRWLEHARHCVSVPNSQLAAYRESYLDCESLTYACESTDTFMVKFHIPDVYYYLVDELRNRYKISEDIQSIPLVRDYVFEIEYLTSKELQDTQLTVLAVNVETRDPRKFIFPPLTPSVSQLLGPLETKLEKNCVYHLRQRHPAIDAVVHVEYTHVVDGVEKSEKYLLLLQVSLSPYDEHLSKGNDIRKSIPKMEGGECSIAEYYQKLGGDITDDRVIYVYVSPKETNPPDDVTFNHELNVTNTKSGESRPQKFWYGFLMSDTPGAILMKQIENSI